jgi:hypothetical protein
MPHTTYAEDSRMREARARYFADNGFGEDGGYGDPWVTFELGPIPLTIPNTAGRKRAVPFHDLHHIVTGYGTDFLGEFEISAWEVGAGCTQHLAAWVINSAGMASGALLSPRRTFSAFRLGRRSTTLYGRDLAGVLDLTVAQTRALCGLDGGAANAPLRSDLASFLTSCSVGLAFATLMLIGGLLSAPLVFALQSRSRLRPT